MPCATLDAFKKAVFSLMYLNIASEREQQKLLYEDTGEHSTRYTVHPFFNERISLMWQSLTKLWRLNTGSPEGFYRLASMKPNITREIFREQTRALFLETPAIVTYQDLFDIVLLSEIKRLSQELKTTEDIVDFLQKEGQYRGFSEDFTHRTQPHRLHALLGSVEEIHQYPPFTQPSLQHTPERPQTL